jgi:uncharacterized protein (DUF1697 family)
LTKHVALLRAVNVGGTGAVKMAELRAMAEAMGFTEVQTLLQSGNLVFRAPSDKAGALEGLIQAELARRFGLTTAVIVRSAKAWADMLGANPFPAEAKADPSHLLVTPLSAAPAAGAEAALRAAIKGRETARVIGDCAWLVYPDGIGESKLTMAVVEARLGVTGTARNWNTASKIAALLAA